MGIGYVLPFNDLATGAVADTFKTMAAILVADTAGHRCRLRAVTVGYSDDAPSDLNCAVKIVRIADVSIGTAGTAGDTVSAAAMPKVDSESIDCLMTGPRNYSAEPTTYDVEPLWSDDLNIQGGIVMSWDPEQAPVAQRDQLLGLLASPRTAQAIRLSGSLAFEIF